MLSFGRKENFPNHTPGSSLGSNQSLVISLAGQMGGNMRQHAWQSIGRHFEESDCWERVVSKQLDSFLNLIMTSVFENITSLMVIILILLVYMTLC